MHHHCVFEDRGPNCSAHRLKRRPLIMLATSCWRPQTYASARGCVTVICKGLSSHLGGFPCFSLCLEDSLGLMDATLLSLQPVLHCLRS